MKKPIKNNIILTKSEKDLEESLLNEKWDQIDHFSLWKKELQEAAKETLEFRKSKRITVRVNQGDLYRLKARAVEKNIPYQTLINIIIRNFVRGGYSVSL